MVCRRCSDFPGDSPHRSSHLRRDQALSHLHPNTFSPPSDPTHPTNRRSPVLLFLLTYRSSPQFHRYHRYHRYPPGLDSSLYRSSRRSRPFLSTLHLSHRAMTPPVRKPSRFGGLQVRICGRPIQSEGNVVCTLPPSKYHNAHAAVVMGGKDGKEVYAFLKTPDGDVQVWQLVGPRE
jgi:hypothetical protein